jgi:hypothetical protein
MILGALVKFIAPKQQERFNVRQTIQRDGCVNTSIGRR